MTTVELPIRRAGPTRAFAISGVIVACVLLVAFVASNVRASIAQQSLRARWERIVASHSLGNVRPGDPVADLVIPSLGLDAIVVEGPSGRNGAPVHLPNTAFPGMPGTSAIESGRLGYGGFFSDIDRLDVGDELRAVTPQGFVRYTVNDVRIVDMNSIDLSGNGDAAVLILIAPASRLGGSDRILVRARQEDAA